MHMDKIANGAEALLLRHNSRTTQDAARAIRQYGNKNIDPSRTQLNYNLTTPNGKSDYDRFRDRLAECSYRKQRNNVRMESIVLTAPKNLPPEDTVKFFRVAHRALQGLTGGEANEVSAWVHEDETTPHLHYAFVPAVEVDGVLKLSAKRLMDRQKLQILHPTVQNAIDRAFGHNLYRVVAADPAERMQTSDTLRTYKAKQEHLDKLRAQEQAEQAYLALTLEQQAQAQMDAVRATQRATQAQQQQEQAHKQYIATLQQMDALRKRIDSGKQELDTVQCRLFSGKQDIADQQDTIHVLTTEIKRLQTEYASTYNVALQNKTIAVLRSDPDGQSWWAWAAETAARDPDLQTCMDFMQQQNLDPELEDYAR